MKVREVRNKLFLQVHEGLQFRAADWGRLLLNCSDKDEETTLYHDWHRAHFWGKQSEVAFLFCPDTVFPNPSNLFYIRGLFITNSVEILSFAFFWCYVWFLRILVTKSLSLTLAIRWLQPNSELILVKYSGLDSVIFFFLPKYWTFPWRWKLGEI